MNTSLPLPYAGHCPRMLRTLLVLATLAAAALAQATTSAAPPQKQKTAVLALPAQGISPAGPGELASGPSVPCDLDEFAENIKAAVDGKCVGYQIAIFHDAKLYKAIQGGLARTGGDAPARSMSASDRLELASVSKSINAMTTIKVLASKGKTVDEKISKYLPDSWDIDDTVSQLTFRHLLSHKSKLPPAEGVNYDPGTVNEPVKNALQEGCTGSDGYNNINYDILRVAIPYLVDEASMKAVEDDEVKHEKALADCFASLARQHVFQPAGIGTQVYLKDWHPSGSDYNYACYYDFPTANSGGEAGPDRSLQPGRGGWKMTASQLAQVAAALNAGYILTPGQYEEMKSGKLGIFSKSTDAGTAYGHSGANPGDMGSRTGYLIFPGNIQAVLLVNSKGNDFGKPTEVLADAFNDACKSADLVVTSFYATGAAKYEDGKLKVPFFMMVKNQGKASTENNFVNAVRFEDDFRWTGIMDPLGPGSQKGVSGTVSIPDPQKKLAGKTIKLVAFCDAPIAAADTSMPPYGRVKESNEPNNVTKFFEVKAPLSAAGDLAADTAPQRVPGKTTKTPQRVPGKPSVNPQRVPGKATLDPQRVPGKKLVGPQRTSKPVEESDEEETSAPVRPRRVSVPR